MDTIKKIGKAIAKSKAKLIMIVVIAIFCSATIYAAAANSTTVTLEVDGKVSSIVTMRTDAKEILAQAGIEINENDIVDVSAFENGASSTIRVYKSHVFTVSDNGSEAVEHIGNGTVSDVLGNIGITLNDGDEVNCNLQDYITDGLNIKINRAFNIKIMADGKTFDVKIAGGTVSDALDKAVIVIDDDDIISKTLDTALEPDMFIKITRVEVLTRTETIELPYKTITKTSSSMFNDQSKIETAGVNGQQTITYREKYVDGIVIDAEAISSVVDKEPVDEVKIVGTKNRAGTSVGGFTLPNGKKTISTLTPPATLELDGNVPVSYKKKIVGTASAYSCGTHTATGKRVRPGYIAVDPKEIPYGTKMWIVSNDGRYIYGYASAEDTGGFINWTGSRETLCDLYFPDSTSTYNFGRRKVTIYIL